MSSAGETLPSTWVTSSSRNTRVTWQIASDSRMWLRNLLPSPSPSDAPRTMPAMSTNWTVAGRTLDRGEDLGELAQPRVRYADHADVRLDRRERVVRREHVVLGQRVEERGLARVGEPDDSDGECHGRQEYASTPPDPNPQPVRRTARPYAVPHGLRSRTTPAPRRTSAWSARASRIPQPPADGQRRLVVRPYDGVDLRRRPALNPREIAPRADSVASPRPHASGWKCHPTSTSPRPGSRYPPAAVPAVQSRPPPPSPSPRPPRPRTPVGVALVPPLDHPRRGVPVASSPADRRPASATPPSAGRCRTPGRRRLSAQSRTTSRSVSKTTLASIAPSPDQSR